MKDFVPGDLVYSVTVPCVPESMAVLEDLCEAFIEEGEETCERAAFLLRLSAAEACRNAIRQRDPESTFNLATLRFLRTGLPGPAGLVLEITDPGTGLPLEACRPPYPAAWLGKMIQVGGGARQPLLALVEGQGVCSLHRDEGSAGQRRPSPEEVAALLATTGDGSGLVALRGCWRSVRFSHDSGKGTTLRLEGPRLDWGTPGAESG